MSTRNRTWNTSLVIELERFLLELGNDFPFFARQRRLRIGTEWYQLDLLLLHTVKIMDRRSHNLAWARVTGSVPENDHVPPDSAAAIIFIGQPALRSS